MKPLIYHFAGRWFANLILMLFCLPLGAATNSAWFARAWQTEDGLPEHTIVGLERTPDGYLWVATHRALTRFDGVRFQEFAPVMPVGSPTDQLRSMLLDRHGRLWLARDGGVVVCVEAGKVTRIVSLRDALPGAQARVMAEDAEGSIWISDTAGFVFRIQDLEAKMVGTSQELPGQGICWLTADVQGQLWFSQSGSVGVYRGGRFVTLLTMGQQSGRLAQARLGGIWIGAGLKLYRYREGGELESVADLQLDPSHAAMVITALYEDKAHGVWIGTSSGGLFRFDSQGIQSVDTSHPNIINVLEDSEGNVWVGTRGGGLNRLSPRAVQLVGPPSGLPFATVQSTCEDTEGTLWAAGQNGALARRSNGQWSLVPATAGWSGAGVSCVAAEVSGGVLIGTREGGVFRHQNGAFTPLAVNRHLANPIIRSLYPSTNGDLWIAITSAVVRLRAQDGSVQHFPLPAGASDVRTMVEDTRGHLWMGTTSDGQLLRMHEGVLINETTNIMRGPQHIRCLQATSDGCLWMGFVGQGLGRLKNGRYFQFGTTHGLSGEYISQILPDDHGRLWLAGNRGIFQVARSELEAVAEGRAFRARSVVFGRGEGVPNLQATFGVCPAASRTRDGRLLMPMLSGLAIVEPRLLPHKQLPPPVIIERLTVNGRIVAAYDVPGGPGETEEPVPASLRAASPKLRLGPGVGRMVFEFTALSLASPENVLFRYQFIGLDQDWVDAGAVRVARYPQIPPGDYRFRVTACNHDGIWNEVGAELVLTVTPYVWEATWFRVIAAICASGLLGAGVLLTARRRYRRKLDRLEQQQALERERARIAQDLHDDLGAGLVEINLGSELAQDPAIGAEEVREHTLEIGTRAREMVTALDEIVWAVNPKHDSVLSLATYFCQFAQHFLKATSVRCHLEVARDLPAAPLNSEQRHGLFLAFKEALCNVVQHAGATDLRLAIAADDGILIVALNDNGCGFDPSHPRGNAGADGLENMQRRLQQFAGCCEVASRPGQGTKITFKVPLSRVSRTIAR